MNPELAGWQILAAFVILGGELCYWIDRWEARSYAKALPLIDAELNKLRSRTPGGSTQTPGAVPQPVPGERTGVEAPHHPAAPPPCPQTPAGAVVGDPQTSRACRATTPQAPVDGGHTPVTSSTGLNPGGRGLDSPALAGPPPWRRVVRG